MKVYWWQNGIHIDMETQEEIDVVSDFSDMDLFRVLSGGAGAFR